MPEISVGAQIFDLVFHPTHATVYTGLLTGHVRAFAYNEQGNHKRTFSVRPSKRSCRSLAIDDDGSHLYAVGKSKALNIIDTVTQNVEIRPGSHDSPINRIKYLMPCLLSTGDDDGVIKLWDSRQRECTRTYTQHFDYITDFLWLDDKKQLVATSGDGTLSVMDIRSKKPEPIAQSEDQEDELLSIVSIKGGSKFVVGTQIGVLSIFNRSSGWGDCVDRIPGHPHSIDTLCTLPPSLLGVDTASIILTGSSDGFVRAVKILPTKLMGVVADHGEWPVERIAIGGGISQLSFEDTDFANAHGNKVGDRVDDVIQGSSKPGRGRWWVGSLGHEEVLRLTDLEAFFHERNEGEGEKEVIESMISDRESDGGDEFPSNVLEEPEAEAKDDVSEADFDAGEDSDVPKIKKRKRKSEKDPLLAIRKKRGKNTVDAEPTFFDGL